MKVLTYWFILVGLVLAIDPYQVLGVSKDADEKTIKSAYRQLSKQYHPDKNSSPEAHDKFIEVGEAYDILGDATKKLNFDRFGDANANQGGGGGGFDFGDMFQQFFHGGQGGQAKQRGPDTQVNILVLLKEFFMGKDIEFDVEMNNICGTCAGSGSADGQRHRCSKCGGSGIVTVRRQMGPMVQQFQSHCDQCQGKGTTITKHCSTCHGKGTERKSRHFSVYMSPGTPRNHNHVLQGEGDQSPDYVPGNMNLKFGEQSSENWGFRRIGNNLYRTEVLSAKEAYEGGWVREITFFDEETINVKRAKGEAIIDGEVEVVQGHGMPFLNDDSEFGNLYVQYKIIPVGKSAVKDEL